MHVHSLHRTLFFVLRKPRLNNIVNLITKISEIPDIINRNIHSSKNLKIKLVICGLLMFVYILF